jgi:hypothetical protein
VRAIEGRALRATDCVKTLEMCFDSAQHERFRIVISSTYPFALSAVERLRKSFHTICRLERFEPLRWQVHPSIDVVS